MRLPLMTVLSIIGFSSLSQAAECYAQSGGASCVKFDELSAYGKSWCDKNFDTLQADWWRYRDSNGNTALIGKIDNFVNPQQCATAFADIVNGCFGKRNGGSWTARGVSLNINFCAWPPVFQVENSDLWALKWGFLSVGFSHIVGCANSENGIIFFAWGVVHNVVLPTYSEQLLWQDPLTIGWKEG